MYWSTAFTINAGVLTYSLLLFLWGVFVGKKSMAGFIEKNAGPSSPMSGQNCNNSSFSNSISLQVENTAPVYTKPMARISTKQLQSMNNSSAMSVYHPITHKTQTPRLISTTTRTTVNLTMKQQPPPLTPKITRI